MDEIIYITVILLLPIALWLAIDYYAISTNNTALLAKSDNIRRKLRGGIYGVDPL